VAVALLAFAVSIVLLIGGDALRRETYLFLEPGSLSEGRRSGRAYQIIPEASSSPPAVARIRAAIRA
jgi:hypothetical protein